jgi:uncharacterized protein YhaN
VAVTEEELAQLQADVAAINTAIKNFTNGDRVSEVRFADRIIKYSEITLTELTAERDRLVSLLPGSVSRIRPLTYRGL